MFALKKLQYILAVALLKGEITADSYSDEFAKANPKLEELRSKMHLEEDKEFSKDYMASDKRYIANAVQVEYNDGSKSEWVRVDYPLGHRKRRMEAMPVLKDKLNSAIEVLDISAAKKDKYNGLWDMDLEAFLDMPLDDMISLCQI